VCGLRTRIRLAFETRCSNKSAYSGVGRKSVKNKTVYATTQPPQDPPSASTGVEGVGSSSGALEVMVKSEAKESIVVYVVGG